jgi:hypothetical protein
MFRTKRFELVELIIAATVAGQNTQVFFQNQPQLQSISGDQTVYVKCVEVFDVLDIAKSPFTSGNNVATVADLQNATLTLVNDAQETLRRIPLAILHRSFNSTASPAVYQQFLLKNVFKVDWTKSYVTLVATPAALPFSYLFGVHYDYEPDMIDTMR